MSLSTNKTPVSVSERLERYLSGSRPHHAVILAGPQTPEKDALVRKLAARLLQRLSAPELAAGIADRVARDIHPDVTWIQEEGEDTIKIDRIREICHQMEIAPLEAGAKICIIQECQRMGHAASNAFLKTLEEPLPNRFFWLMTSQIGSLLPTLLSRCLVFLFPPDDLGGGTVLSPHWAAFEKAWTEGRFEQFAENFEEKAEAIAFARTLQEALRNTALLDKAMVANGPTLAGVSSLQALRKFDEVVKLERQLKSNANFSLLVESTLTRVRTELNG